MVKKALGTVADFKAAARAWNAVTLAFGAISMEFSKSNLGSMISRLNELLSDGRVGMEEPFVVFLMDWVSECEQQLVHLEEASPVEILRHLMAVNGLKQSDLADIFGGQPVVSAVLRGKREINAKQALRLGKRFRVSAAVFIGQGAPAGFAGAATRESTFESTGSKFNVLQAAQGSSSCVLTYVQ